MIRAAKYPILLLAVFLLLAGCTGKKEKRINWNNVSLHKKDKDPYGSYIAYQSLPHYFPSARVTEISSKFRYTSMDNAMGGENDSPALFIVAGLNYYVTDEEWTRLKSYVSDGNELFIISANLDNKIANELALEEHGGDEEHPLNQSDDGSNNRNAIWLNKNNTTTFGYQGRALDGHFTIKTAAAAKASTSSTGPDSLYNNEENENSEPGKSAADVFIGPEIIGSHKKGPDFVRYRLGMGHITLHAAPLVISNYFLLQPGNRAYLDGIWHSFPPTISKVYWNSYYKRTTEAANLGVLLRYPATRWGLSFAIAILLIYVLFGLKRRQRIIPVVPAVENASVSFVETVGRLYYNRSNHANLAEKMIQHFLEWVRTYYYLDTTRLDDVFVQNLVSKSGKPEAEVSSLVNRIHDVRLSGDGMSEAVLFSLYQQFQSFYNNKN